jgi:preprotein translocase subunit SecA
MRKVERDIYLQVLDNLWMQHLENMDHLREGIHWMSVGQQDPLVEYRRRGQLLFEEMHQSQLNEPVETQLTLAARRSVDNADRITEAEEFDESDFTAAAAEVAEDPGSKHIASTNERKKARKAERQRKAKAKKRK